MPFMNKASLAVGIAVAGALAWAFWPSGNKAPSGPKEPELKIDPATAGSISGTVRYEGPDPSPAVVDMSSKPECHALHPEKTLDDVLLVKGGRLAHAVVYVKSGLPKGSFAVPEEPVQIDQAGCMYLPRVSAARAGQPIRLKNSDAATHNVKAVPQSEGSEPFNVNLQTKGSVQTVRLDAPEVAVPLLCSYHPWMLGHVAVFDHPFFQVTGEDGAFSLKGLPPGEYEIEAWHERLGTRSARVRLDPKGDQTVELSFKP